MRRILRRGILGELIADALAASCRSCSRCLRDQELGEAFALAPVTEATRRSGVDEYWCPGCAT